MTSYSISLLFKRNYFYFKLLGKNRVTAKIKCIVKTNKGNTILPNIKLNKNVINLAKLWAVMAQILFVQELENPLAVNALLYYSHVA